MRSASLRPLVFSIALLSICLLGPSAWADTADDLFADNGNDYHGPFDINPYFGSGATGDYGRRSVGVNGETHPYSLTKIINDADGLPIYSYPNKSQTPGGSRGTDGQQTPTGTHGGIGPTTSKLLTNGTAIGNTQIPSGSYDFGFSGGGDTQYKGMINKGQPQPTGGNLPACSTSSVDLSITDGK